MTKLFNQQVILTGFIFIALSAVLVTTGRAQGVGLGTETPTEILHLKRDQNIAVGDVAIRYQTQNAGTGAIVAGPNSGTSSNRTGTGTVAWSNPTNADASNDAYATATFGPTNYLFSDIDFNIPAGATINDLKIEIEKSYYNNPVTPLDPWSGSSNENNSNRTYSMNYTVSAGTDRMLVVMVFQNNGDGPSNLNSVTYGGIGLTNQGVIQNGNNDDQTLEMWTLDETGLGAAVGTLMEFTWSARTRDAQFYYAGTYQYVDQTNPVSAAVINTANDVTSLQVASALTVNEGDVIISTAGFGNDKAIFTEPSGYSVQVNTEFNSNKDGSFSVSTKSITASGSEQPTNAFAGAGLEDMSVGALVLNNGFGATTDFEVSLAINGTLFGANLASGTAWTTTDTYTTYTGSATLAQINDPNFGVVISATVAGKFCTAQIDHVRITVTYTTTPAVYSDYTAGMDISTGYYVISQSSSLGTNDIMRMTPTDITFSVTPTVFSDARYKRDIVRLNGALQKLNEIEGVSYSMRTDDFPLMAFTDERQIGFIAQDVEKVFPELVRTDAQGYKSVAYASMTPVLVEAIKELNGRITALEEENARLSAEIDGYEALAQEVEAMKQLLNTITAELGNNTTAKK